MSDGSESLEQELSDSDDTKIPLPVASVQQQPPVAKVEKTGSFKSPKEEKEDIKPVIMANEAEPILKQLEGYVKALNAAAADDITAVQKVQDDLIDLFSSIADLPEGLSKREVNEQAIKIAEKCNVTLSAGGMDSIAHLRGSKKKSKPSELLTKLNARIDKFTGSPTSSYTWDAFLTQFKIAIANLNYDDDELRTILLMSIEGDALTFFQGKADEFLVMSWSQLLNEFAQRFDKRTRTGILSLMGMTQASDESVRAFLDRMRIAAKPLMPAAVPKKRVLTKSDGTEKEVDNPLYPRLNREREITVKSNEQFMVQFFTAGLRREILQRLQTTDFPGLDQAAAAAYQAEDYLNAVGQYHSHHLKVHAIKEPVPSNALQEMERRSRSRSNGRDRDLSQGRNTGQCYNCQEYGHFARECKRSGSQRRKGNNTRSSGNNDIVAKLNNICQRLENLESGSKGQKKKKGHNQSNSKSPHRSTSRGRTRHKKQYSRNSSGSRSQSKGSNYGSRNNSKNRTKN
jgi:hypothetical protein